MNSLPLNLVHSNVQTMSSREIAELCGKKHRHVCRDIDVLNKTYTEMGMPKIGQGYYTTENTGNQQHREFFLTKEQTIDLITGYRAELRIRINRRWQELENLVSGSNYQRLVEQNQALQAELLKARPFWSDVIRYKQLGLATHEIAKLTERGKSTINTHIRLMQQLGYDVPTEPQPSHLQLALGLGE